MTTGQVIPASLFVGEGKADFSDHPTPRGEPALSAVKMSSH